MNSHINIHTLGGIRYKNDGIHFITVKNNIFLCCLGRIIILDLFLWNMKAAVQFSEPGRTQKEDLEEEGFFLEMALKGFSAWWTSSV